MNCLTLTTSATYVWADGLPDPQDNAISDALQGGRKRAKIDPDAPNDLSKLNELSMTGAANRSVQDINRTFPMRVPGFGPSMGLQSMMGIGGTLDTNGGRGGPMGLSGFPSMGSAGLTPQQLMLLSGARNSGAPMHMAPGTSSFPGFPGSRMTQSKSTMICLA